MKNFKYSIKEYTSVWTSKYCKMDTPFKRWIFPHNIILKDKKSKEIMQVYECGWFTNNIKKVFDKNE